MLDRFPRHRPLRVFCFVLFGSLALFAGCDRSPTSSSTGDTGPLSMTVTEVRPFLGAAPADPAQNRWIEVMIYDVTDTPRIRNRALQESGLAPDVADTTALSVEGGVSFFDKEFTLALDEDPSDFRVLVRMLSEMFIVPPQGARTVNDLSAGDAALVDIYLVPGDQPGADDYGLQIADTWVQAGDDAHLIPLVLVNGDSIGGFQFDMVYRSTTLDTISRFVIDDASRLYIDPAESSITPIASSSLDSSRTRVIVYTDDAELSIEPGWDIILYLEAAISPAATNDTLRLENVFFSDSAGDTLHVTVLSDGGLTVQ